MHVSLTIALCYSLWSLKTICCAFQFRLVQKFGIKYCIIVEVDNAFSCHHEAGKFVEGMETDFRMAARIFGPGLGTSRRCR